MSRKLSRTVLNGGKGGDNIKILPITINPHLTGEAGGTPVGADLGDHGRHRNGEGREAGALDDTADGRHEETPGKQAETPER